TPCESRKPGKLRAGSAQHSGAWCMNKTLYREDMACWIEDRVLMCAAPINGETLPRHCGMAFRTEKTIIALPFLHFILVALFRVQHGARTVLVATL
ncbi:MAG TPA: hypothetical protein DCL95_01315, partial [Rhodospirillaceae bacterium]|nr:hypothetical protein [Rhodospirillaceae bacterium]